MARKVDGCPYCNGLLKITELTCPKCEITISGAIIGSRLARLPLEQQRFIEKFVLVSGSLKAMADELDLSYPTVRSRLDKIIEQLDALIKEEKKLKTEILKKVEQGRISAEEATKLIEEL